MVCPKCGAKLVSGTVVCPICGSRQRNDIASGTSTVRRTASASNGTHQIETGRKRYKDDYDDYEDEYDDDYDEYEDDYDDYDDDYDEYEDDYDDYDDDYDDRQRRYKNSKKKSSGKFKALVIAMIAIGVVILGVLIALIVMLMQKEPSKPNYLPQTIEVPDQTKTKATQEAEKTKPTTEEEPTTEVVEKIDDKTVRVGDNIFERNEDGYTLVEYHGTTTTVILPSEIGGYPLTEIGTHAFAGSKQVQYLKLPKGMKRLTTYSLYDLTNLKEIVIPDTVEQILTYAFSHVETCITTEGSFAATHMLKIAGRVIYGDTLSTEGNNTVTPYPTNPPISQSVPYVAPTTVAQTTVAPQPTTTAPVAPTPVVPTPVAPTPSEQTTAPSEQTTAPSEQTTAPSEQTTAPSEQTTAPSEQTTAPSEQTTAPSEQTTAPSEQTTVPSEQTTVPSEQTTAPSEQTTASFEQTTASSEQTTESEEQTTIPLETVRNMENVKNAISEAASGTVLDRAYQYGDFNGSGNEIAFAAVQHDGGYSVWFNSIAGSTKLSDFDATAADISGLVTDLGLGCQYFVFAAGTTSIYSTDGINCNIVAERLPGVLDIGTMTLNSAAQTAYITVKDGVYSEYAATNVSRDAVAGMTGGKTILELLDTTVADTNGATFWNRANDMIQVSFPDGRYVNLYRVGASVSLVPDSKVTSGTPEIYQGTIAGSFTSLNQIYPEDLPVGLSSAITITEGVPVNYDINGDGAEDSINWIKEANAEGQYYLILQVNGSECYRTTTAAINYTVELCDIDSDSEGLNVVIYGTGGTQGNFLEITAGASSPVLRLNTSTSIFQGMAMFSDVGMSAGRILNQVEGDGVFNIMLANPIDTLGGSTCYVAVPYTIYGEDTSVTEYEIANLSGVDKATLVRDIQTYTAATTTAPGSSLPAGTVVVPKKIVRAEGNVFVYAEGAAPVYILVDGEAIFQ